jgi:hypothetical protein
MTRYFLVLIAALALREPCLLGQETVEALRRGLPASAALVTREGRLWLRSPAGKTFEVLRTQSGEPVIATDVGPLTVHEDVLLENRLSALDHLTHLLAVGERAGADLGSLKLRDVILIGPHLFSPDVWVLPEGMVRRAEDGGPKSEAAATLAKATSAFQPRIETMPLSPVARRALSELIDRSAEATSADDEIITPPLARRVLRHGDIDSILGTSPEADALRSAVREAVTLRPETSYTGEGGLAVLQVSDAYGDGGWTIRTPHRAGYARILPAPQFDPDIPQLSLVADLPPDADPIKDAARAVRLRVYKGPVLLATWSEEGGFVHDAEAWRGLSVVLPRRVKDFFPPHILHLDLRDDVVRLLSPHGSVVPARDGSESERRRFIAEAAKALPTAAYLDLIGEHLFRYVNDSPDPAYVCLVGTETAYGEIHQTVEQTLATSAGGICRGDCDDLAEVYHAIATEQGKLPHIMNLPGHNALGWVDRTEDGQFHTYVLQTGPPMEFAGTTAPESLQKAYTAFSAGQGFDPDQVPIALRFSGDNVRSDWVLGWRIFTDPEYARIMIDVQRDWHFSTYRRGVVKMERLVASGDDDPANIRELASLAGVTGQWELAAKYQKRALESGQDPTCTLALGLMAYEIEMENDAEAIAIARRLITESFPEAEKRLGEDYWPIALGVANTLLQETDERNISLGLAQRVAGHAATRVRQLDQYRQSKRFDKLVWDQDEHLFQARMLLRSYAYEISGFFHETGLAELDENLSLASLLVPLEYWLARIAFHDVSEGGEIMTRYATAGSYYRTMLGWDCLRHALADVAYPTGPRDHTDRLPGLPQFKRDLPWIKASVDFWAGALGYLFRKDAETLEVKDVLDLAREIEGAYAAGNRLGFQSLTFEQLSHGTGVCVALVTQDRDALRLAFRRIHDLGDKGYRDLTRGWLSTTARFLDVAWFRQVLEIWKEEVDYKPSWFAIAWACRLNKAPDHALVAVELGAAAYPDDDAFQEELAFMKELLGK